MALRAGLIAVAFATAVSSYAADPVTEEINSRPGLSAARRVMGRLPSGPAAAVILEGSDSSEFEIYAIIKGRALMIYTHHAGARAFSLDDAILPFSDPYGGKTPTLAYRVREAALDQSTLTVLRYKRPYFETAGAFPEGSLLDVDGDKKLDVVFRRRPLGQFFRIGCGDFEAGASKGFETDVAFFDGKTFSAAPARAKKYLEAQLARDEAALAAAGPSKVQHPGDYLGKALTVYFGHAKLGRAERGWEELERALQPPSPAPPGLAACLGEVRDTLRAKLRLGE